MNFRYSFNLFPSFLLLLYFSLRPVEMSLTFPFFFPLTGKEKEGLNLKNKGLRRHCHFYLLFLRALDYEE